MAAWVLLRHTLPDGSWHHDWMVEDPDAPGGGLITFRLDAAVPWPPGTDGTEKAFEALRLGVHRREYLAYEGEVSEGRGTVVRVASGECGVACGERTIEVVGKGWRVRGQAVPGGGERRWRFEVVEAGLEDSADSRILPEPGKPGERSNR